jgi:quaternary ammonium compound-resistance protein SugE
MQRSISSVAWFCLVLAGIFEVGWALALKSGHWLLTVLSLAFSMGLLALAMRQLPLGTAYAVWVGIGAIGAVVAGAILYAEPMGAWRLFVALLVVSLVGLKLS